MPSILRVSLILNMVNGEGTREFQIRNCCKYKVLREGGGGQRQGSSWNRHVMLWVSGVLKGMHEELQLTKPTQMVRLAFDKDE